MQRLDFTIIDGNNHPLHEPAFIEHETDLPVAVMQAVNDFLDAYDGELTLPLRIDVTTASPSAWQAAPAPIPRVPPAPALSPPMKVSENPSQPLAAAAG